MGEGTGQNLAYIFLLALHRDTSTVEQNDFTLIKYTAALQAGKRLIDTSFRKLEDA